MQLKATQGVFKLPKILWKSLSFLECPKNPWCSPSCFKKVQGNLESLRAAKFPESSQSPWEHLEEKMVFPDVLGLHVVIGMGLGYPAGFKPAPGKVGVRVRILVPAIFQTSRWTSKTAEKRPRYA